jgi:sulfofructose kinase
VPLTDFSVFSDAGLLAYTGSSDVDAALVHVAASHDGHVGTTCGRDGCAWCERSLLRRVPAPAVEVVDTLAAGAIFHGAFALAILDATPRRIGRAEGSGRSDASSDRWALRGEAPPSLLTQACRTLHCRP